MSIKKVILHVSIAALLSAIGIYVLINKQIILPSRFAAPSGIDKLDTPGSIFMALSFFIFTAIFVIGLSPSKKMESINQVLLFLWFVTLGLGLFL